MAEDKKHREHREWLSDEVREHLRSARAEMRESVKAVFPPAFLEHRRAARKEFLLAARELINGAIERT